MLFQRLSLRAVWCGMDWKCKRGKVRQVTECGLISGGHRHRRQCGEPRCCPCHRCCLTLVLSSLSFSITAPCTNPCAFPDGCLLLLCSEHAFTSRGLSVSPSESHLGNMVSSHPYCSLSMAPRASCLVGISVGL